MKRDADKSDSGIIMVLNIFLLMNKGIIIYTCVHTVPLTENRFSMESTHQIIQNVLRKISWKQIPALMEKILWP